MSSKESKQSINMEPASNEFWKLLSKEIYNIYTENILDSEYIKKYEDVKKSGTEDVSEQEDYTNFVKTKLE